MGLIPQHLLDDWERQQHSDYDVREKHTVVKLPCCGASVEREPDVSEQFVTCPNKWCSKNNAGIPARHLILWSNTDTQIRSEGPQLEL